MKRLLIFSIIVTAAACGPEAVKTNEERARIDAYHKTYSKPRIDELITENPNVNNLKEGDAVTLKGRVETQGDNVFVTDGKWRYQLTKKSVRKDLLELAGRDVLLRGVVTEKQNGTVIFELLRYELLS